MPPKKPLPDAPIIFTLRLPTEDAGAPAALEGIPTTDYAEILRDLETSYSTNRFTVDVMKEVLTRTRTPTYSGTTACFWCCHPFSWSPCVLPVSYDAYENMYACEGHYCSPECAMATLYADASLSDSARWTRHSLLADLYRGLYTKRDLIPAPPRTTLRLFGGPLDIQQFREYTAGAEDMVTVQMPPLRLHLPSMNIQGPVRDVKKFVALSQETVDKASKEMRLKRSKPVHVNIPTLDKCMLTTTGSAAV